MKTIIVTGSVGSGKTTFAKKLSDYLEFKYVDVNEVIKLNNLGEGYDKQKECLIVDSVKLGKVLDGLIDKNNSGLVIDSHMSHYVNPKNVDLCVVTKCDLKVLKKRLESRGYSKQKIKDNIEAEIFNTCFVEAKEKGHKILIVDTSHGINENMFNLI